MVLIHISHRQYMFPLLLLVYTFCLFDDSPSNWSQWYLIVIVICSSLMASETELFFFCHMLDRLSRLYLQITSLRQYWTNCTGKHISLESMNLMALHGVYITAIIFLILPFVSFTLFSFFSVKIWYTCVSVYTYIMLFC